MKPYFILVTGPPASGKTINAKAIQEHFKADYVIDDYILWNMFGHKKSKLENLRMVILRDPCDPEALDPFDRRKKLQADESYTIDQVKALLGAKWIDPVAGYVASAN